MILLNTCTIIPYFKHIMCTHTDESRELTFSFKSGVSANAVPHYQKLRNRVTHIWGNRKGQPNRSAMERPRPERTSLVIKVPPVPGKYA